MLLKRSVYILGALIVLAVAGYARLGAFWAVHDHPVETAYTVLAMKMGTHPSLTGYHVGGTVIRRRGIPEMGEGGRMMPVTTPQEEDPGAAASFEAWPSETNPFYFKPPMFPALLAFSHHRTLGARFPFYPLLTGEPEPVRPGLRSQAVFEVQSWAAAVPFLSGLAVILLTFVFGWILSGPGAGLLAAALTAAHPYQIRVSAHIWPEATLTAFLLLTAIVLHFFLLRRSWAGCFAAGMMFAAAVLTDHAALFAVPAFWLLTAAAFREESRPLFAKIFNPCLAAFTVGALMIAQSWIGHAAHVFSNPILSRASFEGLGITQAAMSAALGGAGFVFFCPPLLAALRPAAGALFPALVAASLIALRGVYHFQAPWDERAWAVAVPFAALAAAPTVLGLLKSIFLKVRAS